MKTYKIKCKHCNEWLNAEEPIESEEPTEDDDEFPPPPDKPEKPENYSRKEANNDIKRDKKYLEDLWLSKKAPWKVWN